MAKRLTIQEKEIRALTKQHLDSIGELITKDSAAMSRVRTGDLRDSQNFRTRPYNVLTVSQNFYGKYLFLRDKNSGPQNALKVSIEQNLPDGVTLFVKDMIDLLKSPITLKK